MTELHLVSWNRPKMTKLVIETIHRNTTLGTFRLCVLDNGSEPEVQSMLKTMLADGYIHELIQQTNNSGLESARDRLFTTTKSKYFVDIDNDCLPSPINNSKDWLERLTELMDRNDRYAAIACRTQVMIGTGNIFEDDLKNITSFPHPGGSLRIMRTSAVKEVGGWDKKSPGRGSEERYICGKLREAGYNTGFATHIYTLHLFGVRNQTTERWGYKDGMLPEETGHSDIWHPALQNGDDISEVTAFCGDNLAERYFS